ncbi:TM2 domain containing protein [Tritrichomonas foetus]|uniref:TM2 domain containing protein n=1 Tax=Tritrichomonas foetus TaxID=1144522 RepID=A0A1J4JG56_9EUKA|nr:TM2 domain containing protein [Tritrichomonas foetus]|eukprot:OHS98182.1 TM2 domain containing protein [Tritrichomonas foetus]
MVKITAKMFYFLFVSISSSGVYYRVCNETTTGRSCTQVEWNTSKALIPCSLLPREYRICSSRGLQKFTKSFPDMPAEIFEYDGCNNDYSNINKFGVAVCQPLKGVTCLGEPLWFVKDFRCFEEGESSYIPVLICSLFFGIFGVDRYLLGYPMLGTIKLLTLGGFGFWYITDLVLISLGYLNPHMSTYKTSY